MRARTTRAGRDAIASPVRLLALDGFMRLYVRSHDKTDGMLVPSTLVRIWWPA